jgi:hypothetical protein
VVKSCLPRPTIIRKRDGPNCSWVQFFLGWWLLLFSQAWWGHIQYGVHGSSAVCDWKELVLSRILPRNRQPVVAGRWGGGSVGWPHAGWESDMWVMPFWVVHRLADGLTIVPRWATQFEPCRTWTDRLEWKPRHGPERASCCKDLVSFVPCQN